MAQVNHKDGDPLNNDLDNLEIVRSERERYNEAWRGHWSDPMRPLPPQPS